VNFVIAFLILMGFVLAYGDGRTPAVAREVVTGSAAANAGMLAGDRITALGGRDVATFDDVAKYIQLRANQTVHVDFDRNGRAMSVDAAVGSQTLRDRFGNDYKLGLLGIAPVKPVWVPVGVAEAPVVAVKRMGSILTMMVDSMGQIIAGKRPVSELGGPLRIAKVSGEQLALGLPDLIGLIALVSINLGFINILPVPMLDGGHLFFYAVEAIRRRPVRPEVQEWAFRGGLIAILALMLMVTFNDLGSFGLWNNLGKSLAGLIG
jgi:regulator of sigma E protease